MEQYIGQDTKMCAACGDLVRVDYMAFHQQAHANAGSPAHILSGAQLHRGTMEQEEIAKALGADAVIPVNGAGIPLARLRQSTGRPKGARNLNAKHPSSLAKRFKAAGLDWAADFAIAIKNNKRERIAMWLRLLPYMVTTTNRLRVKKWKGKASKAAIVALNALEGR